MTAAQAPQREIGYAAEAGPTSYSWWMSDGETTPELRWPQSVQVYDQMRTQDAQIQSVLRAVTMPVRRTPWRIDPNGARDEVVRLVADDLGLPVVGESKPQLPLRAKDRFSWGEHLRLALLMLPFGHMYFEQVYRVTEDGSRAHLRKLGPRMPRTISEIEVARDGGLVSIKQWGTVLDGSQGAQKPIPVNRLVAYVLEREGGNWLGRSILRSCYKNWLLKDRLLRVDAQTIERNGMGIPTYTAAENENDLAKGVALATSLRAGETAGAALPNGATLELLGVTGTLPQALPSIRYHDEQVGRAVLAHFLNLDTQSHGSWALGTTFADFFTLSLQTLADEVADTATQHVVEDLVDANWGPDEPAPRIVHDEIGSRQAATAAAIKSLVDAGILEPDEVLESSTRQQYGLPPKDPETTRGQDQGGEAGLGQPFYAPDTGGAGGSEVYASADIDDYDDDEPGQFDELTAALAAALSEFIGEVRAAGLSDWDPSKHPRDKAGRFRTVYARVMHALELWARGEGGDHPLKGQGFTTANLRTVATKHLGLKVRRSTQNNPVTAEELEDLLLDHVRAHVRGVRDRKADEPKRQAKFTLQHGEFRDKDVAVYRLPGDKPALFYESDAGKRGGLVERFDDLDGLQRWADEHGETRLAEWARKEGGGKAPQLSEAGGIGENQTYLRPVGTAGTTPLAERVAEQLKSGEITPAEAAAMLGATGTKGAPEADLIGANGLSTDPAVREVQVENRIRAAYRDLAGDRGGFVGVAALRERLGDVPRAEVDDALRRMSRAGGTHLAPQDYGSMRSPADDAAALTIGGRQNHLIQVDDPSPRPLPGGAPRGEGVPGRVATQWGSHSAGPMTDKQRDLLKRLDKNVRGGVAVEDTRDPDLQELQGRGLVTINMRHGTATVTGRGRRELAAPAPAKKAPGRAAVDHAAVVTQLDGLSTREEAHALLADKSLADLKAIAKAGGTYIGDTTTKDGIRARIVEHHVGFRLNSATIRGGTWADLPDASDPEALRDALDLRKVDELKAMLRERGLPVSGRKRELVDRLVDAPSTRAPVAKAPRATHADGLDDLRDDQLRSLAAEFEIPNAAKATRPTLLRRLRRAGAVSPYSGRNERATPAPVRIAEDVPLIGDPDGDNSIMHGDSASMGLAQAYAAKGRNGTANRIMELRRYISTHRGEGVGDLDGPQRMVDELKQLRAVETDDGLKSKLDRVIRQLDIPRGDIPPLPDGTPPALRQLVEDLNRIPVARAPAGHRLEGVTVRDASAVERLAQLLDRVAASKGQVSVGQTEREISDILRTFHESVDGAYRMWDLDLRVDQGNDARLALQNWVRSMRGGVGPKVETPAKAGRAPATPVPIRDLFDADDATIETALRDVFEGKFGPYTTKASVHITRAGTRVDKRGRQHEVKPSIGVDGKIYDADGNEIGHFGRGISPVDMHYADGTVRREMWANHQVVELGGGDYDENPTRYHGKGFGGEFNRRAIQWYRDSGVHGISQKDHNGYVWASQGFNFSGGVVPDYLAANMRQLIADLRAGKRTSDATKDEYHTIPKRFRDAPDVDAQIAAAEALLVRLATTKPGEPGYPTAYEISQLGRRPGQRGKTALWLGKLLWVSADEMILNPDEGEVISQ